MISEETFDALAEKARRRKYSSMNYVDYEDCANAEIIHDRDDLVLLLDRSKTPAMLYFGADDFAALVKIIAGLPGKLRVHFVPRAFAARLEEIGFAEWGEYADFFNDALADTAARLDDGGGEILYLGGDECSFAAAVSQRCKGQSRGYEGESAAWFAKWLEENKVIVLRVGSAIAGFCCVSIYQEGTMLWVREVAVDPAYQGKGLGKKLIGQAIRYGVENGAVKGFLAADILNANAIGLYEKYGFRAKNADRELQMIKDE